MNESRAIHRVTLVAGTVLRQALRSRGAWFGALALLLAAPVLTLVVGAESRLWLARTLSVESLRLVLPLAAIAGGAFLLRPGVRRGWALLKARRGEWFVGAALAGCVLVFAAALLFTLGAAATLMTLEERLVESRPAVGVHLERLLGGERQVAAGQGGDISWANPAYGEEIHVRMPDSRDEAVRGTIEFRMVWTARTPPSRGIPFELFSVAQDAIVPMALRAESGRVASFEGVASEVMILRPADPALIVGVAPEMIRIEVARVSPLASLFVLLALGGGGAVLCLGFVLLVSARWSAATAALAGLLLFAALTLLPGMAPTPAMAQQRLAAMRGAPAEAGDAAFGAGLIVWLSRLPELMPKRYFEELPAGRAVGGQGLTQGLLRFGAGLLLLLPGAWLFTGREQP